MKAVSQPRRTGTVLDDPMGLLWIGQQSGVGQFGVVGLDVVEAGVVGGAGNGQKVERPAFVCLGIRREPDQRRGIRQTAKPTRTSRPMACRLSNAENHTMVSYLLIPA